MQPIRSLVLLALFLATGTVAAAQSDSIHARIGDSRIGDSRIGDSRIGDSRIGDSRTGDSRTGDSRTGDSLTRAGWVPAWAASNNNVSAPTLLPLSTALLARSLDQDTIPRRRASVQYSDGYGTRASIHRRLSYAMLPLFAASYVSGDKLFKEGSTASSFTKYVHRGSATAVGAAFAVNALTGGINLWQGRHDPAMRKRRVLHAVLFTAASAGFTYAGSVLANEAETSLSKRQAHRNLNLFSMGLSGASVLIMTVGPNR